MQRSLVTVFLCFFGVAAWASDPSRHTCENAPEDALLKLQAPYDAWFKIECNAIRKANFISAQDGYEWKEHSSGKAYSFNAYGPISPEISALEKSIYEPHKYRFLQARASVMSTSQLQGVNALLPGRKHDYKDIRQLDVLTNTRVVYSFFIFVEEQDPEWLVVCVNYRCDRAATVQVRRQ